MHKATDGWRQCRLLTSRDVHTAIVAGNDIFVGLNLLPCACRTQAMAGTDMSVAIISQVPWRPARLQLTVKGSLFA